MNSLVRVFSNFREFYSEINGATLTGAIDVIVVEQPNGEFQCSPFHVRFGKLGVLRSREKIVDIEINGEPVDIHMKLGDSGEAFFVEECPEEDIEELPANLATSPIPTGDFQKYNDVKNFPTANGDSLLPLPIPRRNSIDFSKECNNDDKSDKKFENQISDFKSRRHTDNTMERRDLSIKKKEFTTQKIRQEWAEHEEQLFQLEGATAEVKDYSNNTPNITTENDQIKKPNKIKSIDESIDINLANKNQINDTKEENIIKTNTIPAITTNTNNNNTNNNNNNNNNNNAPNKDESKMKKKRRKKSQMKKKNVPRKSSSSSSVSSSTTQLEPNEADPDTISLSNNTGGSSNDESSSKNEDNSTKSADLKTAEDQTIVDSFASTKSTPSVSSIATEKITNTPNRMRDLDIHFFSDTEVTSTGFNARDSRPSTPIQSDSELEMSQREKGNDGNIMTNSASWKWGELPTQNDEDKDEPQAQRNSMLSGMFSFMKKTNKMRKNADGGVYLSELDADVMDPEMAALYFPPINKDHRLTTTDDDRESGNGTSLPHSPSSMDCPKSLDSDYEEGKMSDNKYLDFVAMSMCGGIEKGGPTDEEFDQHLIKYSDVCQNPSLFSAPNLVVRLNGKYYSWIAACPIIMTIITFKKPLSNDAVEQLMNVSKPNNDNLIKSDPSIISASSQETKRAGYTSWWYWRRSGAGEKPNIKDSEDKIDNAVSVESTASNTPDGEQEDVSILNTNNSSLGNNADISQSQNISMSSSKGEKYRKTLRLSSEAIKRLNLKSGMNEIEFSVTTAYQGTSRCKCYLFRWKHNDKVVISDIDGTITKSDVLGHILPMVGKDWAQIGVAQLFSKIEENGYKLLYLSARAIGQSRVTREYLRSIRQGDVKLPDGPLLLNPTSLISAFHREVIERKPEQFKIACLSDIQALFPEKNPFYAGYGNRINDVWAYRAVGIPIMRIFTINTKGELKHELTQTFQSSYCSMTYIVDQLFPPLKDDEGSIEFSNFNYWREPIFDLQLDSVNISGLSSSAPTGVAINSVNNNTNLINQTNVITIKPLATIPEN